MLGVTVNNIDLKSKELIIDWSYNGQLDPKIEPIYCNPSPHDIEDAMNLAMAVFIPSLVAVRESIKFKGRWNILSERSLNFWRSKMWSLRDFYKTSFLFIDGDIGHSCSSDRIGTKKALLWGGGIDSAFNAVNMVNNGEKPILVHIQRREAGWKSEGMFQKCQKEVATVLGLEYEVVESNSLDVQRSFWNSTARYLNHNTCWNWSCTMAPHDRRSTSHIISGFAYFFTVLAALDNDVIEIIMAGATDDPWEPFGYGVSFWDDTKYRGIKFSAKCLASKAEEYGILFREFPEVAKWIKPCWNDNVQWCGKCKKCRETALMLKANCLPVPFELKKKKSPDKVGGVFKLGRLLATLYHYRKQSCRNYEIEKELSEAIYYASKILEERSKGNV